MCWCNPSKEIIMTKEEIDYFLIQEHFVKLCRWIAELEREACAKICDKYALEDENWAGGCAFAIRKRGKE